MWIDRPLKWLGVQRLPTEQPTKPAPRSRASYGSYAGAERNRLLADWIWRYVSADQEVWRDLLILRGRARELVRNTSWGRNYVRLVRNNVIGHAGITLQGRLLRADNSTPNEPFNDQLEEAWADWGQADTCTADGRLSWLGVQHRLGDNLPMDGEFLVRILRGFDNKFGFALQLLDPDQLDHMYMLPPSKTNNEVRQGVEIDQWNRPVAYYLWRGHPTDPYAVRERIRVPAADIIHVYDPYRVNQTRGVTWLAASMADINMLRGYYEAELVAARVAAAKGGFFYRETDDDDPGPSGENTQNRLTMEAEPGVFDELPAGLKFQEFKPEHPTTAFPDFSRALLRSISAGIGVSATALTNDLSDVNYSSIRAGLLHERDEHRRVQQLVIESFHQRVYREWLRMARLGGQLDTRFAPDQYLQVAWRPRGWSWVDPKNDVEAAILASQNGMDSRQRIMGEDGIDFFEIIDDLKIEKDYAKKAGVSIEGPQSLSVRPQSAKESMSPDNTPPAPAGNGNGAHRIAALLGDR